jgi:hypothetical protein
LLSVCADDVPVNNEKPKVTQRNPDLAAVCIHLAGIRLFGAVQHDNEFIGCSVGLFSSTIKTGAVASSAYPF